MAPNQLKAIYQKIKTANRLLEEQALKEGVDVTSPQYDTLKERVRDNVLEKNGFNLTQYIQADAQMKAEKQAAKEADTSKIDNIMKQVQQLKGEKGDTGEQGIQGERGEQGIQGEQGAQGEKGDRGENGLNGIDGKNGKDGRDGRDGRDGVDGQSYNPSDFNAIVEKVSRIPQKEDLEEFVKETVGYSLKASTEIMGMPNFRKLAMGIRGDLDALQIQVNKGGGGGTGYSIETPSGTVDGSNVTFTVTNTPVFVMGDGVMYFNNAGYTISGTTVTMDSPPSYSIRSFYGGSNASVPITRTLTINGVTYDLSTNRSWTVSGGSSTYQVVTLTDAATVTPDTDTTDMGILLSLSQTTLFANPTGSPTDGKKLILRIKSTSAQALTWGSQYRSGTALPNITTGSTKTDYFNFIYNAADNKWDFTGSSLNF